MMNSVTCYFNTSHNSIDKNRPLSLIENKLRGGGTNLDNFRNVEVRENKNKNKIK